MTHGPRHGAAGIAGRGAGPRSRAGYRIHTSPETTRVRLGVSPSPLSGGREGARASSARERKPGASARALSLLAACALGALAAGCKSDPTENTGAIEVADYRARHPIVLTDGTRSLDVFPTGVGHLDPRQTADADAFMLEYRRYGRGTLLMEVPRGVPPAQAGAVERTAAALTRLAAQDRVGAREIAVTGYAVTAPSLAAPIRLSFQRMQAKVSDACGLWPQDTGTSNFALDYSNRPMWNLGCAMQSTVAAQVADPVDLVRGRPEGRIDTVKRVRDIGQLREGKDPSTTWRQDGQTDVKSQVGQ